MNFHRAAVRLLANNPELSEDDSMDPTNMGGEPWPGDHADWQPGIRSDGLDPAAPGGPSPFNAADPGHGEPVASDPLYKDPDQPSVQGHDQPHVTGPNLEAQTLHNARRARYAARTVR